MLHRKKNLTVVKESEEQTDRLIEKIVAELNDGQDWKEQIEEQTRKRKKSAIRQVIIGVVSVIAAAAAVFLFIHLQTYTAARVSETYKNIGTADSSYKEFARGVLKYSRDGISYWNQKGEEQWNQPYQIKNPFMIVNDTSGAVADKGGNDIIVFQKEGVRGEIHTTLPIEKIAVSEHGIVCAILKNGIEPKIICYDTTGNILVEHKSSLAGTGYPMAVDISPGGEVMQVVYFYTHTGRITSKVIYYNFGEAGENKTDHQVSAQEYEGTIMASGFFLSEDVSAAVGDNLLTIYKGGEVPKEEASIKIDKEIENVFHNKKYIGMVLRNEGKGGYELRLYNTAGKKVLSENFTEEYNYVKLCGSQIIMYDGRRCSIYMRSGIKRFEGEMRSHILEIFPVAGVNKYVVINANGMEHVRLVK